MTREIKFRGWLEGKHDNINFTDKELKDLRGVYEYMARYRELSSAGMEKQFYTLYNLNHMIKHMGVKMKHE